MVNDAVDVKNKRLSRNASCLLFSTTAMAILALIVPAYLLLRSNTGHTYQRLTARLYHRVLSSSFHGAPDMKQNGSPSTAHAQTMLWQEVGCQSAMPILLCERIPNSALEIALVNKTVFSNTRHLARRSKSCALVGSSGKLLSQRNAESIDRHDVVIRVNDAPIHPYEKYVGRRMPDVAIINRAIASKRKCLRNVNRETLLVQSHHPGGISTIGRFCYTQGPIFALSQHIIDTTRSILSTYRMKHGLKRYRSPSAGMYAVVFALHLCSELDVYGFGAVQGQLYSYYRDHNSPSNMHVFDMEEYFLRDVSRDLTTPVNLSWTGCTNISYYT
ncbi:uncharacterized protein LOC134176297 [Corticium candelabrum]|uniref:uncharacterized protein LOC134176297 n=1 Tax=Corticium candelabrum TaxID=121492 RepID=UPI002E252F82|nr:uncharacterized protein LOC134176297 [Corticium candelabrum]